MANYTDATREASYVAARQSGYTVERVAPNEAGGKGMRRVLRLKKGRKEYLAQEKVCSKGAAIIRSADKGTGIDSPLSGIDEHVDHVFFAVRYPESSKIDVFLVPSEVAESAWKAARKEWLENKSTRKPNDLWTIYFYKKGGLKNSAYSTAWEKYKISSGTVDVSDDESYSSDGEHKASGLSIEEAKNGLAERFNVSPDAISISISG